MAIKVTSKKCFTASHKQSFQKLANYVMSHYPKDTNLHKAVRGTFKAMDDAAAKMGKAGASKKRATSRRRTLKRATPKRRTAKRSAPKRRTARRRSAKRAAPKRRRMRRRAA